MESTVYYSSYDKNDNYGVAANHIHLEVADSSKKGTPRLKK